MPGKELFQGTPPTSRMQSRTSQKGEIYLLGGIILLALILRAILAIVAAQHIQRAFVPDTQSYLRPALELLSTGTYPTDSAWRTPLYPLFVALVYWMAGTNPVFIIGIQVVVSTIGVVLTYFLGMRLLPKPAALLAALLMAISVESITSAIYLMTETLFTFLFLGSMFSMVKVREQANWRWLVIAAILFGLSVLCRPIALYFPVLAVLILILDPHSRWSKRIQNGLVFLAVFAVVLFPWVLRNKVLYDLPTVTTISDYNLLFYNAAAVEANLRGMSEADIRPILQKRVDQTLIAWGEQNTARSVARAQDVLAWQIIQAHPLRYLFLHLKSDLNNFLPDVTSLTEILGVTIGGKGTLSILNQHGLMTAVRYYFGNQLWLIWLMLPLILLLGIIFLFSLAGAIIAAREKSWYSLAILLLPVVYFMIIPGAASVPRFRVPAMPFFCLLAGLGLYSAWSCIKGRTLKKKSI